jgi:ribosomal 30S subunit maturation factor RimM
MNQLRIKTESDKLVELMTWLLGLNKEDQQEVIIQVQEHGFSKFFLKFEEFNLSDDAKDKLRDLHTVLQVINEKEMLEKEDEY